MKRKRVRFSFAAGGPIAADAVKDGLKAERLGYDFIWVADHLSDIPPISAVFDAWTVLAYVGANTKRVLLGSGVTDIQRMHPAKAASTVATLDNLTNGRAVLGIGAGEVMNTVPYGMPWEPAENRMRRLREYLQVAQLLWSSSYEKPVSFQGQFYQLTKAHLGLSPVRKSRPLIYIGAFASTGMLQITGELADGWYPGAFYTPEKFRERIGVISEAARKANRSFDAMDVMANVPVVLSDDTETRKRIKSKFRRSLVINRYMLKLLGAEEAYKTVSDELQYQLITPTADFAKLLEKVAKHLPVTDEQLERGIDEIMAVGSTDRCIEVFETFAKAGARHLCVAPYLGDSKTLEIVSRRVIPHFRR